MAGVLFGSNVVHYFDGFCEFLDLILLFLPSIFVFLGSCTSFSQFLRLRFVFYFFQAGIRFFPLFIRMWCVYLCECDDIRFLAALCRDFVEANYCTPHVN